MLELIVSLPIIRQDFGMHSQTMSNGGLQEEHSDSHGGEQPITFLKLSQLYRIHYLIFKSGMHFRVS
jgi:hypothetical protein